MRNSRFNPLNEYGKGTGMDTMRELIEALVKGCKILDAEGIMDELGHLSARSPDGNRVLMNGKVSPGQVTQDDIVLLDLNGNKIEGKSEPAKEIPLHLAVYQRRPDVMAIAHTHSPTIVALSIAGVKLQAVDNLGATTFGEAAPLFEEYGLVDTFDMGYRITDAMGSHNVIVLKGHGNLVAGGSIQEACVSAIWAEKSALLQYQSMAIGKPQWYPKNEINKIQEQVSAGKGRDRAWNYYRWRLEQRGDNS
jgi:HCOMODA/2-hydroxy-3-carboxy-muconic semialdehyde decarboxylase